jgi:hypothetical protein
MTTGPPEPAGSAQPPGVRRRSLLRLAGLGGATVLVAGTSALSYRVFDTAVLDPEGGDAFDAWTHWRAAGPIGCVAAAVLAANPHNSQAWLFAVSDRAIDLYADRSRRTGTLDPLDREQDIGVGCALENLVVAARARGLGPTATLLPDGPTGDHLATVTLAATASAPTSDPLHDAIGRRHTNRGPYDDRPVGPGSLAALVDTAGLPGLDVVWVTDPPARLALGRLLVDAATAVTRDEQQSRDSFVWFRADNDAVQAHRDGLTLNGQGLPPLTLTLGRLLPASSRTAGDEFWLAQTRDVHTRTAAAYGVITAADPADVGTRLRAGRLLQRIHLTATHAGIALHHMNQITERIDREASAGTGFAPRFAALLPDGARPVATFRVGHPVRDPLLSPRRPLAAVTR